MEWKPIETAPEFRDILVYDQDSKRVISAWHIENKWRTGDNLSHIEINPTHWMPPPEPPE